MDYSKKYFRPEALSYAALDDLCDRRIGVHDVPCPLCGSDRRAKRNQRKQVLRVWHDVPGFASYHCARCGESGWARDDGTQTIDQSRLAAFRKEAAQRDQERVQHQLAKARYLWRRRELWCRSPVERYLREVRRCRGLIPDTIGYLPPSRPEHHPAMIAVFGLADEIEPGRVTIPDHAVRGVHLTLLKPDGSGKAGTGRDRIMVGPSSGWPLVMAPMNDDLGLVIAEGIETALSLHEATGLGAWAAGSAGRMPALADVIPSYVDCVTIAAEPDPAGRKGASSLAERLDERGIYSEVRILGDEEAQAA